MALLQLENGQTLENLAEIQKELTPLNVELKHWPTNPEVQKLLDSASLNDDEKEQVAKAHDKYFNELKASAGYQTRDLIVLHKDIPALDDLLAKFAGCHTHDDDEVRYIVDGEGIFGFVRPDGSQVALTIQAGKYINVPANTEHWFVLTDEKRIKALRYFTSTDGWTPHYTETEKKL